MQFYIEMAPHGNVKFSVFLLQSQKHLSFLFQVEDAVSRVAEGTPDAVQELDLSVFRSQLGPLAAVSISMVFHLFHL